MVSPSHLGGRGTTLQPEELRLGASSLAAAWQQNRAWSRSPGCSWLLSPLWLLGSWRVPLCWGCWDRFFSSHVVDEDRTRPVSLLLFFWPDGPPVLLRPVLKMALCLFRKTPGLSTLGSSAWEGAGETFHSGPWPRTEAFLSQWGSFQVFSSEGSRLVSALWGPPCLG